MTTHYLKIALRILLRMRTYTIVNVVGLTVSLAGAIIIARYLHQELTVDDCVPDIDRVCVLTNGNCPADGMNRNHTEDFPLPELDEAVEECTRFVFLASLKIEKDSTKVFTKIAIVDSMFRKLLPRRVVVGTDELKNSTDAVVTRALAEKLWPGESPIGKTLTTAQAVLPMKIVGVVDGASTKCNFDYDVMVRDDAVRFMPAGWFVCKLKPGATAADFNRRSKPFTEDFRNGPSNSYHFQLMPLKDAYFDGSLRRDSIEQALGLGNRASLRILTLVGILLVSIGLFNFLSIYSIVMTHRRRNFAIRKAFGARWLDVFRLIFAENALLTTIAIALSWVVVTVVSPLIEKHFDITQQSSAVFDIGLSVAFIIFFALYVSLFSTTALWRTARIHSMDNAESSRTIRLRRLMLVPQMVIVFVLIAVSSYILCQVRFMLNADMGFCTEDIVAPVATDRRADLYNSVLNEEQWPLFEQRIADYDNNMTEVMRRLRQSPLIEAVSPMALEDDFGFVNGKDAKPYLRIRHADDEKAPWIDAFNIIMSANYMDVYGIQLVEGSLWERDENESRYNFSCIITETTKRLLGIEDISKEKIQPEKPLWYSYNMGNDNRPYEIVGVVRDIRTQHLAAADAPLIITFTDDAPLNLSRPLVRVSHDRRDEAIDYIRQTYSEVMGEDNIVFDTIEDTLAKLYADDLRTAHVYTVFALMAVLVSILGLYCVVVHDLRHREREIRIRRVYGATRRDIFRLVARPYIVCIALATAIATPLSLLLMRHYQGLYSHHISIAPWHFVAALTVIVAVTLATIGLHTARCTKNN